MIVSAAFLHNCIRSFAPIIHPYSKKRATLKGNSLPSMKAHYFIKMPRCEIHVSDELFICESGLSLRMDTIS